MAREKLFKNLKLQDKYKMWLKDVYSAVEVESKTSKYVVLKSVDTKGDLFWFLGKSGAVRINRKNSSSTAYDFQRPIQLRFNTWCLNQQ